MHKGFNQMRYALFGTVNAGRTVVEAVIIVIGLCLDPRVKPEDDGAWGMIGWQTQALFFAKQLTSRQ